MRPSMSICTPRAWPSARAGTPSRGSWSRPSAACRSSSIRSQLGRVPSRPIEPGHEGQVVGQRGLAEQRLRDAGAERSATCDHLVGGVQRPLRRRASRPARRRSGPRRPGRRSASLGTTRGRDPARRSSGPCRARAAAPRPPRPPARRWGRSARSRCARSSAIRQARSIRWRICAGLDRHLHVLVRRRP